MKYLAIASLLLVMSLYSINTSTAQTRPRRVAQSEPGKSQSPHPDQNTPQGLCFRWDPAGDAGGDC